MEITAINNELVKFCVKLQKKKFRDETGLFLLEGYKSVFEAVQSNIELKYVFVLKEKMSDYGFIKKELILTNQGVLKKISTTDTAVEVVGVGYQKKQDYTNLKTAKKVVLLQNISDPGNLGTIIRTAAAFDIDAVILYGNSVDLYNPKCVRSTVGNLWKTDVFNFLKLEQLDEYFSDFEKISTLPKTKNSVFLKDWVPAPKTLVMFGSEAEGLSGELINYCDKALTIKMSGKVESLNLSVSAGLVMEKMFD